MLTTRPSRPHPVPHYPPLVMPAPALAWPSLSAAGRSAHPRICHRTAAGPRRAGQDPGVPGPPPLDHMTGIQTLPAQDHALLPGRRRVILGHHVQLVLRGGTPPTGPLGHLWIRALLRLAGHPSSAGPPGHGHGHGHLRDISIPAPALEVVSGY
jgi:hypothetical protein